MTSSAPSAADTALRLSADEELHWLALKLVPGLGTRRAVQLVDKFRTPMAIFRASRSELQGAGLSGSTAQSIASGCSFDDAVDQQNKLRANGAELVPITDRRYPPRLREIYDPPPVLFIRGRAELLQSIALGVVGTRRPTPYGVTATQRLSPDLAQAGLTIVSGMARGIDTAAHKSTLAVGGDTLAVFGCGVDQLYPTENRKLCAEIASNGLLVSEFPMEAPAFPQNFPIRNRIISGMCVGVLVIEGAEYSGSSITARMALEQQREVFAVPGSIMSKMSWGPNLLIKQGAKLVQEWNDVVVELPAEIRRALIARAQAKTLGQPVDNEARDAPEMGAFSRTVLAHLRPDVPAAIDSLFETFEPHSSSEIIAALFELEMMGLARQLPGKNFVKVW